MGNIICIQYLFQFIPPYKTFTNFYKDIFFFFIFILSENNKKINPFFLLCFVFLFFVHLLSSKIFVGFLQITGLYIWSFCCFRNLIFTFCYLRFYRITRNLAIIFILFFNLFFYYKFIFVYYFCMLYVMQFNEEYLCCVDVIFSVLFVFLFSYSTLYCLFFYLLLLPNL